MTGAIPIHWDKTITFHPIGFVQNDYHEPAGPDAMRDVP